MSTCRLVAVAVILIFVLAGCQAGPGAAPAADQPTPIPDGDLDVISATGIVVPLQEAALAMQASGRLTGILVSEGDKVEAGQELARIDTRDLDQAFTNAEAGLKLAEAGLAKAKAGTRPEEIASAEAGVAIAQAGVAAAEEAKLVAEGNVAAAQADYEAAVSAVEVARGNQASAQGALASAQAAFNKILAGPTQADIAIAEAQVERAKNSLWAIQKQRDAARENLDGQIGVAEQDVRVAELQLQQLKAGARAEDIAAARAQVAQAQAGVQTAAGQTAQAQAQAERAEANLKVAEAQVALAQSQIDSAAAQVPQAQAQVALLKAGTRPEDIAAAEADVARAQAALTSARNALYDATLRAPFSGTIGEVMVQEGELVTPQMPILRLGDLTRLRVKTEDLGEGDVLLVRIGQPVRVTVDALPDREFKGTVARIAPFAIERRGDKVYDVLVDLELPADTGLRWGMSTFAEIKVR